MSWRPTVYLFPAQKTGLGIKSSSRANSGLVQPHHHPFWKDQEYSLHSHSECRLDSGETLPKKKNVTPAHDAGWSQVRVQGHRLDKGSSSRLFLSSQLMLTGLKVAWFSPYSRQIDQVEISSFPSNKYPPALSRKTP